MEVEGYHFDSSKFLGDIRLQEFLLCGAIENAQTFEDSPNPKKEVKEKLEQFTQTIQETPLEQLNDYLNDMREKIQCLKEENPEKAKTYEIIYDIALDCQEDES